MERGIGLLDAQIRVNRQDAVCTVVEDRFDLFFGGLEFRCTRLHALFKLADMLRIFQGQGGIVGKGLGAPHAWAGTSWA